MTNRPRLITVRLTESYLNSVISAVTGVKEKATAAGVIERCDRIFVILKEARKGQGQ